MEMTPRRAGLAASLVLHALAIVAILSHPPARSAIASVVPIMVSLITTAPVPEPKTPPKPLPVHQRIESKPPKPVEPLPLVTAPSEATAQFVAPAPAPVRTLPPIEAAPRPVAPAAAPVAPPSALVLPRFDAAYLQNPPPAYPVLARRLGEQGRVLLRVLVTAEGTAERVELKASSGTDRLDRAALDAVKRWRFVPARQGGQAVAAWVVVPISFSLEG